MLICPQLLPVQDSGNVIRAIIWSGR